MAGDSKAPKGWVVKHLGAIAKVSSGGTPSRAKPEYWGGNVPWVNTGLVDFNVITETEEHITAEGVRNSSAKVFPAGTLLMAMFGQGVTRGKVAVLGKDAAFNQACVAIVPTDGDSGQYLFHCLAAKYNEIRRLSNSGSQENLNAALIRSIEVPLPPRSEQNRIAQIGDTWDAAAVGLSGLIDAQSRARRGLMQQLLTGKRRFPGFTGRWQTARMGDVLTECDRPVEWNDDELYRLASVRRWAGGLFVREELYGRDIQVKKLKTIRTGDVLISHIQSAYGAMGLVGPEFDGYKVSDMYTVLVPKDPAAFDIRFFAYLAQRREMWHNAYLASNGFFAERLRLCFQASDFLHRQMRIPPTIDEQRRIVAVLEAADREIDLLKQELDLLKKQKRGLMQKLLTGQIRVKVGQAGTAAAQEKRRR
jgi:type I restriction enzyme S subunit